MPGLVDTHIHAPQYSYAGTGLDLPLLQWLNAYTFPAESRFKDLDFANRVYTQVVVSLLEPPKNTSVVRHKQVCEWRTLLCEVTPTVLSAGQSFKQVAKHCND